MLDGDDTARLIWVGLVLTMVLSSLMARRVPLVRLITWSLGWVALFFGAYLLFGFLEPRITAWQQSHRGGDVQIIEAPKSGSSARLSGMTSEGSVEIPLSADGHYWVDATVGGQPVRFLVDSGASITGLSQSTADRLGLAMDPTGSRLVMQTANGTVTASRSEIPSMQIGMIQAVDLPVAVSAALGDVNVLGMNFLAKLKSWHVENGKMVLEAQ